MGDHTAVFVQKYQDRYKAHGDSCLAVGWPKERDARVRHRVMSELFRPGVGVPAVLDFGCGLSHFYEFLKERKVKVRYFGIDVVQEFLVASKKKHPENSYFYLDVTRDGASELPEVDFAVANGVFTEKLTLTQDEMCDYMRTALTAIWEKVKVGLAFNVMTTLVDWTRPDLFHVPFDEAAAFARTLSRHFVMRHDYGLYEYTVYVYR